MASAGSKRKEADEDVTDSFMQSDDRSGKRSTSTAAVMERKHGQDEGIGVIVSADATRTKFTIDRIIAGGYAESTGEIQPGEFIVAVDSRSVEGLSIFQLATLIRGPEDTYVSLTIEDKKGEKRVVRMKRGRPDPPKMDGPTRQLIEWDEYITHEGSLDEIREACEQRAKKPGFFKSLWGTEESIDFPKLDEASWKLLTTIDPNLEITVESFLQVAPSGATTEQLVLAYQKLSLLQRCRLAAIKERKAADARIGMINSKHESAHAAASAESKNAASRLSSANAKIEEQKKQLHSATAKAESATKRIEEQTRQIAALMAEFEHVKRNFEKQTKEMEAKFEAAKDENKSLLSEVAALAATVQRVRDPTATAPSADASLAYLKETARLYTAHLQQQKQQQQLQQSSLPFQQQQQSAPAPVVPQQQKPPYAISSENAFSSRPPAASQPPTPPAPPIGFTAPVGRRGEENCVIS